MKQFVKKKLEEKTEISIKRLYLPFVYKKTCKCGNELELDLNKDYLSYPRLNSIEQLSLYCDKCDSQYVVDLQLEMTVVLRDLDKLLLDEGEEV